MGMGYGANYADVMETKDVQELCPEAWDKFVAAIEKVEDLAGIEDVAHMIYFDQLDDDDDLALALKCLQSAFNHVTGLDLQLGYHDHDECGDRYDEINGHYWSVDGMYELTDAGLKFDDKVKRKSFVTFG